MTQFTLGLTSGALHGHCFSEIVPVEAPAAGAGFTYTNDGRYWERMISLGFELKTAAGGAARQVQLNVLDGSGVPLTVLPANGTQAGGTTRDYYWDMSAVTFLGPVGGVFLSPAYRGFLQPLFQLQVAIAAVAATDAVSNVRLYLERFVTGDSGYLLGVVDVQTRRELSAILGAELRS